MKNILMTLFLICGGYAQYSGQDLDQVETTLFGDFDNDCIVGSTDLLLIIGDHGVMDCVNDTIEGYCKGDIDNNNMVNVMDLLIFLPHYGETCN